MVRIDKVEARQVTDIAEVLLEGHRDELAGKVVHGAVLVCGEAVSWRKKSLSIDLSRRR